LVWPVFPLAVLYFHLKINQKEELPMKNFTIESRDIQVLILFVLAIMICGLTVAQDKPENKTLSPYFIVLSDHPETDKLPLKSTSAEVNIAGVISDVTVHQVYKNEGKNALEAIYTFPASTNAAVYAMEMKIGSRIIKAKIEEKQKARTDYEQAKSEGKRTSLLEQERPNVFQMNVANIMPGDEIEVTMKYTELLIPEGGVYQFVYPTVVGPRYSGESTNTDSFVSSPYTKQGIAPLYSFDIRVNINAGMPIQNVSSTSHKVAVSYPQAGSASVKLDALEVKAGNRDFILKYQLSGDKIESGLILYEHGDENFFLLTVQPPKKIVREEIPAREYIFIVDVSGSMNGFPLTVSKNLMRNLVVNLLPTDKFNIVVFAGNSGSMSPTSVPATLENVEKACKFIDTQNGGGGTNMLSALQNAFALPKTDPSLSRSFVMITDGYVDIEKEAFDLIKQNNDKANFFAFGIGSSVNRFLIEGMAHVGQGEPFVVTSENEANAEAGKFRKYINYPYLTNIKKSFAGFDAYDVEPVSVPDVFAERPVVIFGKYRGEAKGAITIKGLAGKKNYAKTFNVGDVKPSKDNAAIRYLWARKKIQVLDDYNNISSDEQSISEVTNLGLQYNLLTAYTSFIAIEEDTKANDGSLETVKQPLPLPEGVSNSAVGFDMEVESDETFEAFADIEIQQIKSESTKEKVLTEIEDHLIQNLTSSIITSCETISSIKVMVDASGKVSCVTIDGECISEELKEQIIQIVRKWDFQAMKISTSWSFEIKF
jgi:Ca-activated chloride channel family protein